MQYSSNRLRKIITRLTTALALATMLAINWQAASAQIVRQAAGANAADIQAAVDAFRADLGGVNNGGGAPAASGRREVNWDGVPATFSAPNNMPFDFFNIPVRRGAVFATPGTALQVSANAGNATNTPLDFGNLNPIFTDAFRAFSPQKLFIAVESTITDTVFFVPGTNTPAVVNGFGAVFTDVELAGATRIQFFDKDRNLLFTGEVPAIAGHETFSFLGVTFPTPVVSWVRIFSGNMVPNQTATNAGDRDAVAMDDFIFGEPQASAVDCHSLTCFQSAAQWNLRLRQGGLPSGVIRVPGTSINDTVNINSPIVRLALQNSLLTGGLREDLLAEYVAAQLSLAGRADRVALLKGRLNCYGVNTPVALYTDTLLSSFSTIGELFAATDKILENNIADEFVRLLPIYAQLRANCR